MLYLSISSINLGSYSKTKMITWEDFSHMFDGFFSFNENFWCFMKYYSLMFKSSKERYVQIFILWENWILIISPFHIHLTNVLCISKKSIFYNNDLPANILKPFYSESPYICSLLTMAFACKKVEKKEEALTFVFFLGKIWSCSEEKV